MANQTVIVLSNNHLAEAKRDPQFVEKLFRAIDETVRTGRSASIGVNYGDVMPYHHGYDPTLFLSYGGIIKSLGTTTVEKLPHSPGEIDQVVQDILQNRKT